MLYILIKQELLYRYPCGRAMISIEWALASLGCNSPLAADPQRSGAGTDFGPTRGVSVLQVILVNGRRTLAGVQRQCKH